jgi:hypothetical protein
MSELAIDLATIYAPLPFPMLPGQSSTRYALGVIDSSVSVQNTRITLARFNVGTLREVGALRANCCLINNHGLSVVKSITASDAWSYFLPRSGGPLVSTGNDRRFLSTRHLNVKRQYDKKLARGTRWSLNAKKV